MAAISLALTFDAVLRGDADTAGVLRTALRGETGRRREDGQEYTVASTVTEAEGRIYVRLEFVASIEEERRASAGWRLREFGKNFERLGATWKRGIDAALYR